MTPLPVVRVITFGGGFNLPLWAALQQGCFTRQGITVTLTYTRDSRQVFSSLMDGNCDVAMTALDNVVAYQERQTRLLGEEPTDFFAFMGSDDGFLRLVGAPGVRTVADLRGRVVSVDDPANGFSMLLREILERHGLRADDVVWEAAGGTDARYAALVAGRHAATMLRTPFDLQAVQQGCHVLARATEAVGPYLGVIAAARRAWAGQHPERPVAFIRAYREAVRWLAQPAHRDRAVALLVEGVPGLDAQVASDACGVMLDRHTGYFDDARIDADGARTVLALRSRHGPGPVPDDLGRYCDLRYWMAA